MRNPVVLLPIALSIAIVAAFAGAATFTQADFSTLDNMLEDSGGTLSIDDTATYGLASGVFEAGANAIWYLLDWTADTTGGSITLTVECENSNIFIYASDSGDVGPVEMVDCVGSTVLVDATLSPTGGTPLLSDLVVTYTLDADEDGYVEDAGLGPTYGLQLDCHDNDPDIYPGAPEIPDDGIDQDCDGDDSSADGDLDGQTIADGDCDDTDPDIFLGADEYCNGVDNDCDGLTYESESLDTTNYYLDGDEDTFGDDSSGASLFCMGEQPANYVLNNADCDDSDSAAFPGADEYCNGQDNDCDGLINESDSLDTTSYYLDGDGDGFGDDAGAPSSFCAGEQPANYALNNTDCDDGDNAEFPGAAEYCNGEDNDCDGLTYETNSVDTLDFFPDSDSDSYGSDDVLPTPFCNGYESASYVLSFNDCDDSDHAIYPGADEFCDGIDHDCDGAINEDESEDVSTWYSDSDGDGYGWVSQSVNACSQPAGYVDNNTDCEELLANSYPGADELCDGYDNDCLGDVDEDDAIDALDWYLDNDGDDYGDETYTADHQCYAPAANYVSENNTDCDDDEYTTHPLAGDPCGDGIDSDCDGEGDELDDEDEDDLTYEQETNGWAALGYAPTSDCNPDMDGDGLSDGNEQDIETNPHSSDSDGDGIDDQTEAGVNPWSALNTDGDSDIDALDDDDDNDGVPTATETTYSMDRLSVDSDSDSVDDLTEFGGSATPLNTDGDSDINALDTDDDNDNILTIYEEAANTNRLIEDSDSDGIGDYAEYTDNCEIAGRTGDSTDPGDCDNDGTTNPLDPDSDDDSINDSIEGTGNPDGDSYKNYLDTDSDNDGLDDETEGTGNSDGAGGADYLDDDDDNDGVPTATEIANAMNHLLVDSDGDSVDDLTEYNDGNTDGDSDINALDTDDDNDGILTIHEEAANTERLSQDSDGDGINDYAEYTDSCEIPGRTGDDTDPGDCDNDGTVNALDDDSDNDSIDDGDDGTDDPDGDGRNNYLDTDSDNDQLLDSEEWELDTDGDALDNYIDDDDDDDGVLTTYEVNANTDYHSPDSDGDTVDDLTEFEANCDPALPGFSGSVEAPADCDDDGLYDALDPDDDNDTIPTNQEVLSPVTIIHPNLYSDYDGDGHYNFVDSDSDNDGKLDSIELTGDDDGDGYPNYQDSDDKSGGKGDTDLDGLTLFEEADLGTNPDLADSDGDGIDDLTEVTADCGDGAHDILDPADCDNDGMINALDTDDDDDGIDTIDELSEDTDNDGMDNYLDADDDGDGIPTIDEYKNTPEDTDSDGDGTPDYLDADGKGGLGDTDADGVLNGDEEALGLSSDSDDSDGDGLDDLSELEATCEDGTVGTVSAPADCDNDDLINALDIDDDGDLLLTRDEGSFDPDKDGVPNHLDTDSDGDGSTDLSEGDGDVDCDGVLNYLDADDTNGPCMDSDTGGPVTDTGEGDGSCGGCSNSTPPSTGFGLLFFGALLASRRRRTVA
jgi:MYXO-CTERM domain-containing protein